MKLIFVYNADSGLFNTLTDIAHKLLAPDTYQCQLCAITHSAFHEREEWRSYIESLGVECEFLHRDEFQRSYGENETTALPAVFLENHGKLQPYVGAREINAAETIDGLKSLLANNCLTDAPRVPEKTKGPDRKA